MTEEARCTHFLEKHAEYRTKAEHASQPNARAALEAVAREFLRRATQSLRRCASRQHGEEPR
jgi:hypothetical protein